MAVVPAARTAEGGSTGEAGPRVVAVVLSPAVPEAGAIVARLDRPPQTRAVRAPIGLPSLGFFGLCGLFPTAYVAPGLVESGIPAPTTPGLFGTSGVAGFVAALFSGPFIGTGAR